MSLRNSRTYDNLTLLKDSGAVTAAGATTTKTPSTVGGVARVLDMGAGRFRAVAVVDPSVLDLTAGNSYNVAIEGSSSPSFATDVVQLGAVNVLSLVRHEVHIANQVGNALYRYVRAAITATGAAGTTATLNATIFLGKSTG